MGRSTKLGFQTGSQVTGTAQILGSQRSVEDRTAACIRPWRCRYILWWCIWIATLSSCIGECFDGTSSQGQERGIGGRGLDPAGPVGRAEPQATATAAQSNQKMPSENCQEGGSSDNKGRAVEVFLGRNEAACGSRAPTPCRRNRRTAERDHRIEDRIGRPQVRRSEDGGAGDDPRISLDRRREPSHKRRSRAPTAACFGTTGSQGSTEHGLCHASSGLCFFAIPTDGGGIRCSHGDPSSRVWCRSGFTSEAQTSRSCRRFTEAREGSQGTFRHGEDHIARAPRLTLWQVAQGGPPLTITTKCSWSRWWHRKCRDQDDAHGLNQRYHILYYHDFSDYVVWGFVYEVYTGLMLESRSRSISSGVDSGAFMNGYIIEANETQGHAHASKIAEKIAYIYDVNGKLQHAHTSWMRLWCDVRLNFRDIGFTGLVELPPKPLRICQAPGILLLLGSVLSRAIFQVLCCVVILTLILCFGRTVPMINTHPTPLRRDNRHCRWTFLLLLGLCCGFGRASEDEAVLQALQQRARAAQGQNDALVTARWSWTFRHYGLPTPPIGGFYDCVVHRADSILDRPSATQPLQFQQRVDPIPAIQDWTRRWPDVDDPTTGRISWQLHEGHPSIRRSTELLRGVRHFILVTDIEDNDHREAVAIFLEIIWTGPRTVDFALTIPWFTARTTTIRVLEQAGLLTACTTSHRCDLYHNGELKFGVGLQLAHGHFIQIEGFPTSPPGSSSEAEEDSPLPICGTRSPSTSTSSSATTTDDVSTTESSDDAEPEEYTQLVHIYRPRAGNGRPSHVPALIPPGSRTWRTSVFAAWPLLRYQPWHSSDVHRTFYLDYPQGDDVIFKVLVVPTDLATAWHQVLLVILHWRRHVLYQAVTVPPRAVPGHLLAALDLLPWCGPTQQFCSAALNGHPWEPTRTAVVSHGDYARIQLRDGTSDDLGPHLAQVFNLEDEVSNWHSIDAMGLARLRGDTRDAATFSSGSVDTHGARGHAFHGDWYWISMGTLMSLGTLALLAYICPVQARYPPPARLIAGQRRPCPIQRPQVIGLKTYFVTYLMLSQTPISAGLQIPHRSAPLVFPSAAYVPTPGLVDVPACRLGLDVVFSRLPPPGNPPGPFNLSNSERIIARTNLTTQGNIMCAFLSTYCDITSLQKQPRCSPAPGANTTSSFAFRPLPTPARAQRVPIALSDHLDFNFDGQTRTGNGDPFPTGESPVLETMTQDHAPPSFDISDPQREQAGTTSQCPLTCTDRTLNDLFTAWTTDPCPNPTSNEDVPDCLQDILQRPCLPLAVAESVKIYTDGSHGPQHGEEARQTTWAFVILGALQQEWHIVDWYGDFLELDPQSTQWWGAQQDTIQEGETSALLGAFLWILQMDQDLDAPLFSDSKTALNMASGHYTRRAEDDLTLRARATYQLLQTIATGTGKYMIAHIRAHQGHVGNELADYIARSIRERTLPGRPLPRHYAQWFHGHPPMILQASFVMDFSVRPHALPSFDGSTVTFTPGDRLAQPPDWLPQLPTPNPEAASPAANLVIASYNVHTLRRKGGVAYLREQLSQKRVFLVGLQETRTPDASTFDSDYLRFCAPAEKGQGGTELWLSTKIPFAFEGKTPRYAQRQCVQILHAQAELLLAEIDLGERPFLCMVGHGPHKGYPAEDIRSWWSKAGELVQRFRRSRPIVALVDANAAVAPPLLCLALWMNKNGMSLANPCEPSVIFLDFGHHLRLTSGISVRLLHGLALRQALMGPAMTTSF